jgi:hypothetical protein
MAADDKDVVNAAPPQIKSACSQQWERAQFAKT